jgi:hypothetical protein
VIIECKGNAYPGDCDQLEQYGKNVTKENPRLMLIAFRIDDGCLESIKTSGIELFECNLDFTRVVQT